MKKSKEAAKEANEADNIEIEEVNSPAVGSRNKAVDQEPHFQASLDPVSNGGNSQR